MSIANLDKRFRRFLIISFMLAVVCVLALEAVFAPLAVVFVANTIQDMQPLQAFLVAQSALVFALIPIITGAFVYSRIIERRLVAEFQAAENEMKQYYAQRNLMLSDMAHDLRTPVMGISSLAHALEDGLVQDEETRHRYLHSIVVKADKMGDLATMLFDYIKLESKGFELDLQPVDLAQLLLNEAAALYTDAEDAGMNLIVEVPEDPTPIMADASQMKRVVSNLLSNAMRHNPAGTNITLAMVRRAGIVQVVVADTGKSIEGNPQDLFEPFARGDASRSSGGNGLGLSIAKTIVEMHGYTLTLQQPYGTYTKAFIVSCELARIPEGE